MVSVSDVDTEMLLPLEQVVIRIHTMADWRAHRTEKNMRHKVIQRAQACMDFTAVGCSGDGTTTVVKSSCSCVIVTAVLKVLTEKEKDDNDGDDGKAH
jgi:hypothetical protein